MTHSHLIFIGDSSSTLNESISFSSSLTPVKKLIIVVPDDSSFTSEDILKNIPQLWPIEIKEIPANDVIRCALKILEILQEEKKQGNEYIFSITNSLPVFMIAGYFCASVSKSTTIMRLNKMAVEIPGVPFCKLITARYEILSAIANEDGGIESQDDLVEKLVKKFKGSSEKGYTKSNVSNNLNDLQKRGYIIRQWKEVTKEKTKGKTRSIKMTDLGRLIIASHDLTLKEKSRDY